MSDADLPVMLSAFHSMTGSSVTRHETIFHAAGQIYQYMQSDGYTELWLHTEHRSFHYRKDKP